jgi:hypothetical protein
MTCQYCSPFKCAASGCECQCHVADGLEKRNLALSVELESARKVCEAAESLETALWARGLAENTETACALQDARVATYKALEEWRRTKAGESNE